MPTKTQGFTLTELLIVVAVISILASIAIPAYNKTVLRGKRSEARLTLVSLIQTQERFRANCSQYGATLGSADSCGTTPAVAFSSTTSNGLYDIAITAADATSFTATATAKTGTSQVNDTGCTVLTLAQSQGTLATTPTGCW
jgi:type IV pilus assembly protein PilE